MASSGWTPAAAPAMKPSTSQNGASSSTSATPSTSNIDSGSTESSSTNDLASRLGGFALDQKASPSTSSNAVEKRKETVPNGWNIAGAASAAAAKDVARSSNGDITASTTMGTAAQSTANAKSAAGPASSSSLTAEAPAFQPSQASTSTAPAPTASTSSSEAPVDSGPRQTSEDGARREQGNDIQ